MIGSIRFAGDLHPALVIGTALAVAAIVAWLYLRESGKVASPYTYILPGLRASAVALVILILAGPVWHRRTVIGTLGRVVFAIDTSESMSMTDSAELESSPTRLERAAGLLTGEANETGWLESLRATHAVEVIAFSSGEPTVVWSSGDEGELPTVLDLAPNGSRTDLAAGMSTTLATLAEAHIDDEAKNAERAALVLLTDGRDNIGSSPIDMADQLKSTSVRVHSIGMGSEDEPSDVGIANVIRPDSVAAEGRLAGELIVRQHGMNGREVSVKIESAGELVWQKTFQATGTEQSIPFQLDVESIVNKIQGETPRGVRRSTVVMDLQASVEPVEGDSNAANNAMPFRVAASTRDRRLLILDGSSRWEFRYLRNLFERDPAWSVDVVLYGRGTDMPLVQRGRESGQLPTDRETMAQYDAIILGEVPPDQFEERDAELLREFVTRGGGLLVVDGRYERVKSLVRDSLSDLVPVEHLNEPVLRGRAIRPTTMGMDHPVLNLWGDKEQLEDFWNNLPAPTSAPRVKAREGAEVWAEVQGTDDRESPWLITRLFGAGRVFYLSTDQTWRWRYKVADRFHARFWNQLLAAVMQPPYSASDDYVALGTDKIEYDSGQSALIRARVQDANGKPVGDATVDALLISEDRVIATVPLQVDDPARGTYRGKTQDLQVGAYSIRIRASGFDANALQATTPIWVGSRDTVEMSRVSLDSATLQSVTETAEGQYFHESAADQILDVLRPLSSGTIVETDILVWQSFYWFWAVLLLLAIEWWVRKRAGLV
ncbi:MAG: VWA domain-containing protein [Rubripirellula sp.]